MDNTQLLNELYEKIMANRRSDMSDDAFIGLLDFSREAEFIYSGKFLRQTKI